MADTPTVWETGDVITAEKLNKAEQGIASAEPVVLTISYDDATYTYTLNASYNELYAIKERPVLFVNEYVDGQTGDTITEVYHLGCLVDSNSVYMASFIAGNTIPEGGNVTRMVLSANDADADLTFVDD